MENTGSLLHGIRAGWMVTEAADLDALGDASVMEEEEEEEEEDGGARRAGQGGGGGGGGVGEGGEGGGEGGGGGGLFALFVDLLAHRRSLSTFTSFSGFFPFRRRDCFRVGASEARGGLRTG